MAVAASFVLVLLAMTAFEISSASVYHLQPVSPGGYRTYIVLLEKPSGGDQMNYAAHRRWHQSFLPSTTTSDGQERLVHSYVCVVNGFSALLTEEELKLVASKPGFVRAFPNGISYPRTTRTPAFLGLGTDILPAPIWRDSNYGAGVIIGVVDTGVDVNHPSLAAPGADPPPRWKGSCEGFNCTEKLIGGKNLVNLGMVPEDEDTGHGTHTATTAAGYQVPGISINNHGLANGTGSGMAPSVYIAVYKVCSTSGCMDDAIVRGIDAAGVDGVDIISASIGAPSVRTYDHSPIVIAAYGAMQKGIPVVASGGNDGPVASSVENDIPWAITVAAGTVDRSFQAKLLLKGGGYILGESIGGNWLSGGAPPSVDWSSLLYAEEGDRRYCEFPDDEKDRVRDKIVICDSNDFDFEEIDTQTLLDNGASGVVLIRRQKEGYTFHLFYRGARVMQIAYDEGHHLKEYYASLPMATGSIEFGGTVLGFTPAPVVASFSGRGPSLLCPGILKPEVLAPGLNILAGVAYGGPREDVEHYSLMSGTSMATPHVAGLIGLLRKFHPDWSPAAVKSALLTTADILDNTGKPILDEHRATASFYATGAGQVNLSKALDPGLVYDLKEEDYARYICSILGEAALHAVSRANSSRCSDLGSTMHQSNLNYPTIIVPLQPSTSAFVLSRTVTNVSPVDPQQPESYNLKVEISSEVRVTVEPSTLSFTAVGEKASYNLTVSCYGLPVVGGVYEGTVTLTSSKHTVRSRMIAVEGLPDPQPSHDVKIGEE